jgi:hypothetical protein
MLSGPYFYNFDTQSKPGKVICHGVRFESVEMDADGFQQTRVNLLCDAHPELKAFNLRGFREAAYKNFRS